MINDNTILLPRFAAIFFSERVHCRFCPHLPEKSGLRFVGVGRDDDGTICLTCDYQCPSCGRSNRFFDRNNQFTRHRWWDEFVERHEATQYLSYAQSDERRAWQELPKIGPMKIVDDLLGPIQVRGGYKGEVGPVIFLYDEIENAASEGFMRLERGYCVTPLLPEDSLCLPWTQTAMFVALVEGSKFEFDGRTWTKMAVSEIEEIVLGPSFDVLRSEGNAPVTTPHVTTRRGHGKPDQKSR